MLGRITYDVEECGGKRKTQLTKEDFSRDCIYFPNTVMIPVVAVDPLSPSLWINAVSRPRRIPCPPCIKVSGYEFGFHVAICKYTTSEFNINPKILPDPIMPPTQISGCAVAFTCKIWWLCIQHWSCTNPTAWPADAQNLVDLFFAWKRINHERLIQSKCACNLVILHSQTSTWTILSFAFISFTGYS